MGELTLTQSTKANFYALLIAIFCNESAKEALSDMRICLITWTKRRKAECIQEKSRPKKLTHLPKHGE